MDKEKEKPDKITKYLLLMQDSLAIRFSRVCYDPQTQPQGHHLFKGFTTSNLKSHWNNLLIKAIHQLNYKGHLLPSTILVSAAPQHIAVIRNAWTQRMLRCTEGWRIDFVGEIEEIIAEPISQGQFAPLKDSLCWVIMELGDIGQEAFLDSIISQLQMSFPSMSIPNKEILYQSLESLIKDRKIYQTSRGYFVVTKFDRHFIDDYAIRRHNSMRIIRDHAIEFPSSLGARSLSFRLSKDNSVLDSDYGSDERSDEGVVVVKDKKPSFFRRLFKFSNGKPKVISKWHSLPGRRHNNNEPESIYDVLNPVFQEHSSD